MLLKKNFEYTINKSKRKVISKSDNELLRECSYYKSTMISCECGEVALESALYHTKLKYRPIFQLEDENKIEYNEITPKKKNKNDKYIDFLMKHAAKTIKKFSQCKVKLPLIIEYLNETQITKLQHDDTFIGSLPSSFYSAVSSGIYKFSGIFRDIDDDEEIKELE